MYKGISEKNGSLIISGIDRFDAARSCACGQAFRWRALEGGFFGVIYGGGIRIRQNGDSLEIITADHICAEKLVRYFDLERDYISIENEMLANERICACVPYASGIRVFNQEPFEALISFIISANNNVKRISGIIERLCAYAGARRDMDGVEYYAFPTPERVAALSTDELTALGTGYRAPFIQKSARMIADGYDLARLAELPLDEARRELLKFPGVGPKVADCVLLFALGHTDAFPVDVWIDRAMNELFFDGERPEKQELRRAILSLGGMSGIVQQYIFHYIRERAGRA